MTEFIPPYPIRHKKSLGPLDTIKFASQDLLSIWPEEAFERQFVSVKIITRSVFIANCPEVVRHVLADNAGNYEKKSPLLRKAFEPLLGDGLFISDGATWHQRRNQEAPLFAADQVAEYAEIMVAATEACVQDWAGLAPGATVNVMPEMLKLSTTIIFKTLFGRQADVTVIPELINCMADYHAAIGKMDLNTFFGLPSWIPGVKRNQAAQIASRIHLIFDQLMVDVAASGEQGCLYTKLSASPLSREQIRNELLTLFMAGQETAANTLAWAWYLISQSPAVEQRLHEELDAVLGTNPVSYGDFSKLVYTRAIIEETMRLYPPVPILAREAGGEDEIRRRPVAAGSIMLVVPWLLHRHKHYWEKPDHFIPERFLADAPVKPLEFAYLPFSIGPRACIAQFFGTVETTLCLAVIAKQVRLTLPLGQDITHESRLTLRPKGELPMQLMPRRL
ncbi:MAG: cytochrome P450 [Methylococcales bacterium]|nr:cytochrome P450 [Methylococcales bacterium]